jgi:hypothetical protein
MHPPAIVERAQPINVGIGKPWRALTALRSPFNAAPACILERLSYFYSSLSPPTSFSYPTLRLFPSPASRSCSFGSLGVRFLLACTTGKEETHHSNDNSRTFFASATSKVHNCSLDLRSLATKTSLQLRPLPP